MQEKDEADEEAERLQSPRLIAKDKTFDHGSDFYQQLQWSPDGSCILAITEENKLYTFIVPPDIESQEITALSPYGKGQEASSIYSACWYSGAAYEDLSSMCYLVATRDQPVQLHDAFYPQYVRASYPIVDHRERFVAPHSLCFSSDGSKIICGSTSLITVFSLSLPGTVYASFQTASSRRDASNTAQKGIISAMAINPDYSHVLATGTFQGSIGLYADEGQGEVISVFSAHEQTGITQVEWSSCGRYLFVASRRSNIIEVWDIRDYRRSLTSFTGREAMTNQRLGLSKTFDGSRMVSGGIDGVVKTWDMNFTLDPRPESVSSWKAHQAPIGTAACHPSYSLIATCGGSRASPFDTSNDSEDDADEMVVEAVESHIDHTLRIWSYS